MRLCFMETSDNSKEKKVNEPYFAQDLPGATPAFSIEGPNTAFIDFLNRLNGPARVKIDEHQEMLIMALRSRCLKYALSDDAEAVIAALDQLCAFYHQCALKAGLKAFEVLASQNEEYIKVQEQFDPV